MFTANTATNSFTNTNITSGTKFANWRKNNKFITVHNTFTGLHTVLVLTGLLEELT